MDLLERMREFLARERLLRAESRIVVAVSGGPDSLCLLHLLWRLSAYDLHVAHLDHGLRSESAAEAQFVRETGEEWGLPVTVVQAEPGGEMRQEAGVEQAAREARYRFLVRVAKDYGAEAIVTGHTASDQVETIVMNFLRGAGVHGLGGIEPWVDLSQWTFLDLEQPLALVRPLLNITGAETRAYCERHRLSPRHDPSNLDRTYLRNRVRLDLIPILENYQPALDSVLLRTGRVMRAAAGLLEELTDEAIEHSVRPAGTEARALAREPYQRLPLVVRWELLRRLLREMDPGEGEVSFEVVERAQKVIEQGRDGRHTLIGDLELEAAGAEFVLRGRGALVRFPQVPQIDEQCDCDPPAEVPLADGWRLTLSVEPLDLAERDRILQGAGDWADPHREAVDAAKLPRPLHLRAPRNGDRFQPLGMEGSMPLSDFFINEGISRLQRPRWPLLTADGIVIWVVGVRVSDLAKVTADTDEIVRLEVSAH